MILTHYCCVFVRAAVRYVTEMVWRELKGGNSTTTNYKEVPVHPNRWRPPEECLIITCRLLTQTSDRRPFNNLCQLTRSGSRVYVFQMLAFLSSPRIICLRMSVVSACRKLSYHHMHCTHIFCGCDARMSYLHRHVRWEFSLFTNRKWSLSMTTMSISSLCVVSICPGCVEQMMVKPALECLSSSEYNVFIIMPQR